MNSRRDRSRSPVKSDSIGRRRDNMGSNNKMNDMGNMNMNPMMMANNMYQGNMMMGGGMMMPNMMMGMMGQGMMGHTGMEMVPQGGMDMIPQGQMDMSNMAPQSMGANMGNMGSGNMNSGPMVQAPPLPPGPIPPMSANSGTMPSMPTNTGAMGMPQGPGMDMTMMGGMMMDPSMMGNMGMYPNMGGDMSMMQEHKEIVLKYCILTPPTPGTPQPPRRARPPGCRTIFVGGLPDKIRESIVRDIFERYGRIQTLRLSKKNFCHIRFDREPCVDAAMFISGYRIKLILKDDKDDKDDDEDSPASTGWLHVDYASSRDDQHDYERKQRQALRMQQQQMEQLQAQQQEMSSRTSMTAIQAEPWRRSPSPVRVQPFSNAAMVQLSEKIKSEENFSTSLPTLVSWLERGECSKKTSNQFYSMIQATNSHIRRLFNEKIQAEEELTETRERVRKHIESVIETLEQVAKVFIAASHQRVWDHFTKPQRKNIETWQKMAQEFNTLKEEFHEKFDNDDDYNGYSTKMSDGMGNESEVVQQLRRENESLQFQLEAYKNEVDVIKADAVKEMEKFKAQFIARKALQGFDTKQPAPPPPPPASKPPPPPPLPDDLDKKVHLQEAVEKGQGEARLIGVMSAFLQVHPLGASLDYVVSYVRALFPHVTQATVHHVLQKHTDTFKRTTQGIGANIEHKWFFTAFETKTE